MVGSGGYPTKGALLVAVVDCRVISVNWPGAGLMAAMVTQRVGFACAVVAVVAGGPVAQRDWAAKEPLKFGQPNAAADPARRAQLPFGAQTHDRGPRPPG